LSQSGDKLYTLMCDTTSAQMTAYSEGVRGGRYQDCPPQQTKGEA